MKVSFCRCVYCVCLSVCPSVCLSVSVNCSCLPACLLACLSVWQSVCLAVCLVVCLPLCKQSVWLSVCILSVRLCAYCLYLFMDCSTSFLGEEGEERRRFCWTYPLLRGLEGRACSSCLTARGGDRDTGLERGVMSLPGRERDGFRQRTCLTARERQRECFHPQNISYSSTQWRERMSFQPMWFGFALEQNRRSLLNDSLNHG